MRLVLWGVWAAWLLVGCSNGNGGGDPDGALPDTDAGIDAGITCGDRVVDDGEACDDGNRTNGDYCSFDCTQVTGECGDGARQSNEVCELDEPYCNDMCTATVGFCGDGIVQEGEYCDPAFANTPGCFNCRPRGNTVCEGAPSLCGPPNLDWDLALEDFSRSNLEAYCTWFGGAYFGSGERLQCTSTLDAIRLPATECADNLTARFGACIAPLRHYLECLRGTDVCDLVIAGPANDVVADCITDICRAVCTPDTWSCELNTARHCNQWGNGFDVEQDCGNGICSATVQGAVHANQVCGLAVCTPNRWTCSGNTASLCGPDGRESVMTVPCGDGVCFSGGDENTPMDEVCDTNECALEMCGANTTCTNTPGSFFCSCNAGYGIEAGVCTDINECVRGTHNCDSDPIATCTNTIGGFTCACPSGFYGDGVGPSGCGDLDECANGTHDCDENATCTNETDGYTCACNADFEGDGFNCVASPHLISLVPSLGSLDFRSNVLNYVIRVPAATASITITATSFHGTPYQVDGVEVASGATSTPIALTTDPQTITIAYASRTYTIQIQRSTAVFIKPSTFDPGDEFGTAVSISGAWMVVGAPGEDSSATGVNGDAQDNSAPDSGAVYVFENVNGTWTQRAYLKPAITRPGAHFGHSVGISGSEIIIGAPNDTTNGIADSGAVYVSSRTGSTWSAPRAVSTAGWMAGDRVGVSVAIAGTFALVGAEGDDSGGTGPAPQGATGTRIDSGAAYVLELSSDWYVSALIKATNPDAGDAFGHAVAVNGDRAVIGAPGEDSVHVNQPLDNSLTDCGALYILSGLSSGDYVLTYLKDELGDLGGMAGSSVAIYGTRAVSGGAGHAIVHTLQPTGAWVMTHGTGSFSARPDDPNIVAAGPNGYLGGAPLAPDGMGIGHFWGYSWSNQFDARRGGPYFNIPGQRFGASVAVSGNSWVVGAPGDSSDANATGTAFPDAGAVYFF